MENLRCLIIIPAYNEEENIGNLVRQVKQHADVCVINDASTDQTSRILSEIPGIHVINHARNTHIPGAVLDGMRYAVDSGYAYGITMDAGFSHSPEEIPSFLQFSDSDLLIGVRTRKFNTPVYRKVLSAAGNWIYNLALDFPRSAFKRKYYRDITSGFRRYSVPAMKALLGRKITSRSFDFLFESAMLIYRDNLKIDEIPISYHFSNSSLNGRAVRDCLRICSRQFFRL